MHLFKICVQKHTEVIIYLTISSLERFVILYQTSPSLTLVPKQISVRAIRQIKDAAIVKDLDKFSIDQWCIDVNTMVEMYERFYLNCWTSILHEKYKGCGYNLKRVDDRQYSGTEINCGTMS